MNEAELVSAFHQTLEAIDSNFEFWLSATFALILAFYFASEKISNLMYRIVLFLYISTSVLMFGRLWEFGMTNESIRSQIQATGSETYIASFASNVLFGVGFWLIMIVGSIGTVMFVVSTKNKLAKEPPGT
jgi:hypothetical protein